ncbi:MAG: hypothetical protein MJE66_23720 [Proteobacteria bacterium]|nr:hypothetical protein [Pseudomonadota bacterium]
MRTAVVCLGLAAALGLGGCASSSISMDALGDQSIAVLYRTPEESRRRAELAGKAKAPARRRGGVAHLNQLPSYFRLPQNQRERFAGKLAMLRLPTGEVEVVDFAVPGARPQAWSDDRQRLLFAAVRGDARPQLFEWERESGHVRAVTRGPAIHGMGDYGPNDRLVYTELAREAGHLVSRILVTGPGGASPRVLTDGPSDYSPSWSPDGRTLVYVRVGHGGRSELIAHTLETGQEKSLGPGRDPTFTPDGDWVIYSGRTRSGWRLRRVRPDGSGRATLGSGIYDEQFPAVSPDGRFVAYVADVEGGQRLFVRRTDGSAVRVLIDQGDGTAPAW